MSTAEQPLEAESWAGEMGRNWLANLQKFEGMIAPIGAAFITMAQFRPGERVIDIGCGGGGTSMAIGRAVSPGGRVTGLDISRDLIESCMIRASMGTQSEVQFVCADAATAKVTAAPFDRLFSRFGSMFFADPKAAFGNLRQMLKDGGRMDLAVWAGPQENGWVKIMMGALADFTSPPASPPDPHAPGPFAFADTAWLTEVLEAAGFADIRIEPCERDLLVGGPGATPEDAADFILSAMHFAEQVPEERRAEAKAKLAAALAPHHVPGKGNLLPGKALIVTAKAV